LRKSVERKRGDEVKNMAKTQEKQSGGETEELEGMAAKQTDENLFIRDMETRFSYN